MIFINVNENYIDDAVFPFKFSIIMTVYNTEKYLEQSIKSVINQSIGFKCNVQLIIVDDGSTDSSQKIISKYQQKYPDNILLIKQENKGQSNARNNGLKYVEGKYVNFLDSDDYLSTNALETVDKCFSSEKINLVSLKKIFIEQITGEEIFNNSYNTCINLENNPQCNLNSVSSSFFKTVLVKKYNLHFNEKLRYSEDFLFINTYLLYNSNVYLTDNANYFFRKRNDFLGISDWGKFEKNYYLDRFNESHLNLINDCISKKGSIPFFIQMNLLYDLKSFILNANINYLKTNLKEDMFGILNRILNYLDNDIFENNEIISNNFIEFFKLIKENNYAEINEDTIDKLKLEKEIRQVKVSIIIPFFNVEKYIDSCLNSVVNQTLVDIEIICVNDGSTDNSLNIVKEYAKNDSRIKIISKQNEGQAIARNIGIDNAIGEYIGFVDSDDVVDKYMFEKMYVKSERNDLDMVMCAVKTYDEKSSEINENDWYYSLKSFDNFNESVFNHWHTIDFTTEISVTPINKLYNKKFLLKNNIRFPENLIFEDEVFFYQVYLNAVRISLIREPLYTYRINRKGSTVTSTSNNNYQDIVQVFKEIRKIFIKKNRLKVYKTQLYNKMINSCLVRYSQTAPRFKPEFWKLLKADFENIINTNESKISHDNEKIDINDLELKIRKRVINLLSSHSYDEFKDKDSLKKFSVIMAVYNTEKYLDQAINSIINQSIGFVHNIQLILVNDGSTDSSHEIIKYYQQLYPDNIVSLEQKNQGQASARNNGLNYVKGEYVNFLDSDDYLSYNTFEDVYKFFNKNSEKTDVVALPLFQFGRVNGPHILNYKFKEERVIDLLKEPNNPQLTISSTFIKSELLKSLRFNTEFVGSEDANVINKVLLNKKTLGVINSSKYFYRRRDKGDSTLDTMGSNYLHYTPRLKYHFLDLIDYCLKFELHIPYFIQYTLAYDIQWIMNISELNVFEEKLQHEEFLFYLKNVLKYIEDSVILNNFNIRNKQLRNFIYSMKYGKKVQLKKDNIILKSNDIVLDQLNTKEILLDIVEINNSEINISGIFSSFFDNEHISISAIKNNQERFIAKQIYYSKRDDIKFMSQIWKFNTNFEIQIPTNKTNLSLHLELNYHKNRDKEDFSKENIISFNLPIKFNKLCNFSENNNYYIHQNTLIEFKNNRFYVMEYSYKKLFNLERKILKTFKNSDNPAIKYTFKLRLLYLVLYLFVPIFKSFKSIYIFMDRIDMGGDNAEALFNYSLKQKDDILKYFVIHSESKDYPRLRNNKNVIKYNTLKHKLLYLFADKIIVSHPDEEVHNPFYPYYSYYCGLTTANKYFLQHGVTWNNVSKWLKKYEKNLSLITTLSEYEHDSFLDSGYGYDKNIIQVLGFPRYDYLKRDENHIKKQILIMPTWRNNGNDKKELLSSKYFKDLKQLLNSKRLLELAKKYDYKIIFKPHPNLIKYVSLLNLPNEIQLGIDNNYKDLINNSALLITDYSSVSFDFAYLKKPVIYYQYYEQHNFDIKKSYFSFEEMGFGEVIKYENELFKVIESYLQKNCSMESKYKERVDSFFKYLDNKNSKRNYDWIKNN